MPTLFSRNFSSLFSVVALVGSFCTALPGAALPHVGVNVAGADFGHNQLPGTPGVDYIWPSRSSFAYYARQGMTTIRLPFRWERLQRTLSADFDADEWQRLRDAVAAARAEGLTVILDPHNYARYHDQLIGSPAVPRAAFADFWRRLATHYGNDSAVWFGLTNEPREMPTRDWLLAANEAIAAIRATGATNLILVPGNAWTGAHSWEQTWYGESNASVMDEVVDPGDNYAIEVHQYFDSDSSGTQNDLSGPSVATRLSGFTSWCRSQGVRAFLGEWATPRDHPQSATVVSEVMHHLESNPDVWLGWTWWAGGPWWGDYMFTLEPQGDLDRPQMDLLRPHIPGQNTPMRYRWITVTTTQSSTVQAELLNQAQALPARFSQLESTRDYQIVFFTVGGS